MTDRWPKPCRNCSSLADSGAAGPADCTNSPERKRVLRRAVTASLTSMTPEVRRRKSELIVRRVLQQEAFKRADVIMAYVALEQEADPWLLIREAWGLGKTVALPRVTPPLEEPKIPRVHDRQIVPFELAPKSVDEPSDHTGLRLDVFGLWEPADGAREVPVAELDLVIVPCTAFDRSGYRMGKGGGFYDRLLSRPDLHATTCGLAFSEQVFNTLPRCPYDRAVQMLVTETEVLEFGNKPGGRR